VACVVGGRGLGTDSRRAAALGLTSVLITFGRGIQQLGTPEVPDGPDGPDGSVISVEHVHHRLLLRVGFALVVAGKGASTLPVIAGSLCRQRTMVAGSQQFASRQLMTPC